MTKDELQGIIENTKERVNVCTLQMKRRLCFMIEFPINL